MLRIETDRRGPIEATSWPCRLGWRHLPLQLNTRRRHRIADELDAVGFQRRDQLAKNGGSKSRARRCLPQTAGSCDVRSQRLPPSLQQRYRVELIATARKGGGAPQRWAGCCSTAGEGSAGICGATVRKRFHKRDSSAICWPTSGLPPRASSAPPRVCAVPARLRQRGPRLSAAANSSRCTGS